MCSMEKIGVLDRLRSGLCYSAGGRELHVNRSIMYIK